MSPSAPTPAAQAVTGEPLLLAAQGAYLAAALEDPEPDAFLVAVKTVAHARGMTQLAKDFGLGRESLYKKLGPGAKPRYETVMKVVRALGVNLHAEMRQI